MSSFQGQEVELRVAYYKDLLDSFSLPAEWRHIQSNEDILGRYSVLWCNGTQNLKLILKKKKSL